MHAPSTTLSHPPALPAAIAPVYVTGQLAARQASPPDVRGEKLALHAIARQMLDGPEEVLPRLVDIAMAMCGAVAGGISLLEPEPAPGVFRWHHLRGDFERFTGATTPRDFSPCGVTLDQRTPVLVQHPERVYPWLAAANVPVPECLLVPLYLGGNEPLGTLWIVSSDEGHFDSAHSDTMRDLAAFTGIALKMANNEKRLRGALEQQETLTREMSHRVKNIFAIIDSIVRMGARRAGTVKEFADTVSGRLHALAVAHGLVRRSFNDRGLPADASSLAGLVAAVLRPYDRAEVAMSGPAVALGPEATNSLALCFHELATNAVKHGALSSEGGRVKVTWDVEDGEVRVRWQEDGGPPILGSPATKGFGSLLTERAIASGLAGRIAYDWRPGGVAVELTAPLAGLCR